jgi:RNA polymerase sigma factor (sigma-70 family)
MHGFEAQLLSASLRKKMMNIAMSKTNYNIDDSEDLIQKTYLKAFEKQDQFRGDLVDPWVITILKNTFIDGVRKKGPITVSNPDDMPEPSTPGYDEDILLERDRDMCLGQLSDDEREIIDLHQVNSYIEISKDLNIEPGTLRQRLLRAKEKFMQCMGFNNE